MNDKNNSKFVTRKQCIVSIIKEQSMVQEMKLSMLQKF